MDSPEQRNNPQVATISQPPELYFNGFQLGLSNADVYLTIAHNNQALMRLSLSYTTAKTLGEKLIQAITLLERESNNKIMSIEDVSGVLKKEPEPKAR